MQDTTSAIVNGHIVLRGQLRAFRIRREQKIVFGMLRTSWWLIVGSSNSDKNTEILASLDVELSNWDDQTQNAHHFGLYLMLGATMSKHEVTQEARHTVLLLRNIDRIAGIYERIGVASFDSEQELYGPLRWRILRVCDEDAASFPCIAYDAQTRLHTIAVE
jgi:hypothetical protein